MLWHDLQAPLRLPNSEHQNRIDIWTVAGLARSEKMAKSGLEELSLNNAVFLLHV